ncbi:Clp protease N-terminal domain-containing protein [Spirillospora sp. NPDC047279]|uniref:ClpX C4-type zinc finger protein n=1 Tax=Spirillospora sp. NPDC047279 TaxID=3155478 RepID=UPI0033CFFBD2
MDAEALNVRALIETTRARATTDDPLVLLEAAVEVAATAGAVADAMLEHFVAAARSAGTSWTAIGERMGVSKQAARQRFADRIGPGSSPLEAGKATVAPRLAACLEAAQAAADADESVPGTQHLLLGLLHAGGAALILDRAGVTREKIRQAGARLFEPTVLTGGDGRERRVVGDGSAENALAIAHRMAASRGQSHVRTEHLLWELIADEGSASRRVVDHLGVNVGAVKKQLNELIPPMPSRPRRRQSKGRCDPRDRACSFCGCEAPERPMVHGPGVWICTDCVTLATDILAAGDRALRPG